MSNKSKRKIVFLRRCSFCGKDFKTSMPFTKFCSANHRKYFSHYKRMFEMAIQEKAIEEIENLTDDLREMGIAHIGREKELAERMSKSKGKMIIYKKVKDSLEDLVKNFITNKKVKRNKQ